MNRTNLRWGNDIVNSQSRSPSAHPQGHLLPQVPPAPVLKNNQGAVVVLLADKITELRSETDDIHNQEAAVVISKDAPVLRVKTPQIQREVPD